MAFSGVHVFCGFAGGTGFNGLTMPVICKPVWSEAPSTGVTSTNAAPVAGDGSYTRSGQPLFRIRASDNSWVSVGPSPNATSGTRFLVAAGVDYDVYVDTGDKFQWIAA